MKGVGGPLLCIGDLLSDVGEEAGTGDHQQQHVTSLSSSSAALIDAVIPSDLTQLFQKNYNELSEALSGTDHSWTALTLKLCSALETADKLVQSADSNLKLLSEKVGALENIVKRGDSSIKAARIINNAPNNKI